ncbi:MAG: hypothetical protein SFU91_07620 [Chloroherpetonaceae bacterium]|nr:hypothetical protein [Chloroherpetonaceae bacterium]
MKTNLRLAIRGILFMLVLSGSAFAQTNSQPLKHKLETLHGTYSDQIAVDWGRGTYGKSVFTFNNGHWTLHFTLALDSLLKNPVFVFRTVGFYKVIEPNSSLPNTFNAIFYEDKKWVTLKTSDPKLAEAFGLSSCGLLPNIEKDISETGCSLWKPVKACNEDHDLLSLDSEGRLYFGLRPPDNDMCTPEKRPKTLYLPVIKQKN